MSCRSARTAAPASRYDAACGDPGQSVGERRSVRRIRQGAEDRHRPGTPVARTHPHYPHPQRRVRARGSALSLVDGDRRTDHRSALVGPAVLWLDQARAHLAPRGDQSMTRTATNRVRRKGTVRCAVYTRKSSEEGLEQEFNSLQAQREACQAFINSQRHEGWVCLPACYNDGGFSGATMERPALQGLLADITAGRVDTVVVYKIDRLTRSLADFAKIVEILDARGASFVSVTQQFNTTTSMGRLTLNVLLSFAQFEREVMGERTRDKIAASKRRGMWMGGVPPLGYRVEDRKLRTIDSEAEIVRAIFRRYAELGSVRLLKQELDAGGIKSKSWTSASGRPIGGKPFSRGALYLMLQNRTYLGEIVHRGQSHPGDHAPIVGQPLWDAAQSRLADNTAERTSGTRTRQPSLLAGRLFDPDGNPMTPTHAVQRGTRYCYYVSRPLITKGQSESSTGLRIPAEEI